MDTNGVAIGTVVETNDPLQQRRVRVRVVSARGTTEEWARVAVSPCCHERVPAGPAVEDQVLVAFEAGDVRRPYVIGALWSSDAPPRDITAPSLRLPNGASLHGFAEQAAPSTCRVPDNVLQQSAPWLASMQVVIPMLRLMGPLVDIVNGLPVPPVAAVQRFAKAAVDLAPALLMSTPGNALPFVRDLLCVVLQSLRCRVGPQAPPVSSSDIAAIQGILDLAAPFLATAGMQPVQLAAVSNIHALPADVVQLETIVGALGGCG